MPLSVRFSNIFRLLAGFVFLLTGGAVEAGVIGWVVDADQRLATVDVETGAVSVVATISVPLSDIAFSPSGVLFGISPFNAASLYRVNTQTGAATRVGDTRIVGANGLTFDGAGRLLASAAGSSSLFLVNSGTAASSVFASHDLGVGSAGDIATIGNDILVASDAGLLVKYPSTGGFGAALIGDLGSTNFFGFGNASDGRLFGFADQVLYSIEPTTAATTLLHDLSASTLSTIQGVAFNPQAIPEPSSLWLLLIGLVALIRRRRFRIRCFRLSSCSPKFSPYCPKLSPYSPSTSAESLKTRDPRKTRSYSESTATILYSESTAAIIAPSLFGLFFLSIAVSFSFPL
jgi:hypothetical protein